SPRTAIVLGSGLGHFVSAVANPAIIGYSKIPHYPTTGVEGHRGELVAGMMGNEPVLVASGRFHLYEGYDLDTVTLPVRLFHRLGVENLIITNAAGSVREAFVPGTLMALEGHLDFTFRESSELPEVVRDDRFHSPRLLSLAEHVADGSQIDLRKGVYAWTLGPSFETPAEVRLIRKLGGDAVGMSTVPEIRMAGELGLEILTISCLTNYAAGISSQPLTHQEVMETAERVADIFTKLLTGVVLGIRRESKSPVQGGS
ncbi:MAG: purine-nucleoside phosphorylase, partial [Fidelibacterota bacterium]